MSLSSMSKQKLFFAKSSPDTLHATTDRSPNLLPESLQVPKPPPLLTPLLEAGAPRHVAQEMHTFYLQCAKRLRSRYATAISRLRKELPRLPTDGVSTLNDQLTPLFLRLYTKSLQDWVHYEVDMFRVRQTPAHKRSCNQSFNHDYLPILEHFFDGNPFPTHADKASLARKSGMSYQQIHVWFQNRRSRFRKVGKVLRKKSMCEDISLQVCVDSRMTKPDERVIDGSCRDEPEKLDPLGQSFGCCAVSRLGRPAQTELKFDRSWWPRRPSLVISRQSSFDMDGLAERFSRLSVWDRTSGRGKKHQSGLRYPLAATSSTTILSPPSPHPALIRSQYVSLPPLPPLVVPRTSASRSARMQAFNTLNSSPPSTLLASSVVPHFPESPGERREVTSSSPSCRRTSSVCGTRSTFEYDRYDLSSLRTPQKISQSIPCLSANRIPDYLSPKNGGPWVYPVGGRALSQHTIPPRDFRFAVTV